MKTESRDVIFAVLCTILVLFALDYFFPKNKTSLTINKEPDSIEQVVNAQKGELADTAINTVSDSFVEIKSNTLSGHIRLRGAVLNDLNFLKYKQTVEKDSPDVSFLNNAYFMEPVFEGAQGEDVPNENTVWTANNKILTPTEPLTLTWTNKSGVVFSRQIALDDEYMFTITDTVKAGDSPCAISFGAKIVRQNPKMDTAVSVHQGFVGVLEGRLKEEKYAAIENKKEQSYNTTGGWMGLGDKYWLAAFAFNPEQSDIQSNIVFTQNSENKIFTSSYKTAAQKVKNGERVENVTYFFAGPKEFDLLVAYQKTLGIDRFELAIDFGWYYFLTRPFLRLLSWLYGLVGNMGVAILIFATFLRILLLPVAGKSFESMTKMRKIQPKIIEIQKRYKDDKMRLNQ